MANDSIKVLIADSSESFVMYTSILLNRMGIDKVIPSGSVQEMLRLLKMFTPNVILLGAEMPDMNGIAALKQIKSHPETAGIPVIMVGNEYNEDVQEECSRAACSGYLVKPVSVYGLHINIQDCVSYSGGKKRKHLRTAIEKKVLLKYNDKQKEHFALTLSEGGIYIRDIHPLPIGTDVEITLTLKNDISVSLLGRVIYHKGLFGSEFRIAPGMAVEFMNMSNEDSLLLREFITEQLARTIIEEQDEPVISL